MLPSVDTDETNNEGWADAMLKVLNKQGPKDTPSLILAKSKPDDNDSDEEKERKERKQRINKKRKWESLNYVKPNVLEKDYEKNLQKTATRGVIQLFNAVKKHQKELGTQLKSAKTETKKEKVYNSVNRGKFLQMLNEDDTPGTIQHENENEDNDKPAWKVLRDDFMMGNKMKDWDKMSDDEDNTKKKSKN